MDCCCGGVGDIRCYRDLRSDSIINNCIIVFYTLFIKIIYLPSLRQCNYSD